MTTKHLTDRCFDALYRCPACDVCYCDHEYLPDTEPPAWRCPDGTIRSVAWHASAPRF